MNRSRTRGRNRRILALLLCSFLFGLSACSLADALTEMARVEMTFDHGAIFCVLCPATLAALLLAVTLFADGFSLASKKKSAWGAGIPAARNALGKTWSEHGQVDAVTLYGSL